ncbi:hypothetical protein PVAND_016265 [Polypedilum vanderplanki]|uniref:Uncharacterized protein n=1 Tax=Polypedilum vanderplanki TaxID=319348 RepID=A0A9J6BEK8_POLVA|nr:hypothetical protein PVAND_016265 [Polypedilum vanderplanki]
MRIEAQHYDDLLKAYHDSLSEIIKRLLDRIPEKCFHFLHLRTLEIINIQYNPKPFISFFKSELQKYARYGVAISMRQFHLVYDDSETANFNLIKGDEAVPITDILDLKTIEKS